ncbi:MAG: hypothetical protein PHQ93_09465 [Sulfurimonas sp.]|uniref:c-type cytochrome n=1 Tax=Sulfurimonas sp. TaxID=2022749 RepID=UPI00261A7AB2|nr:hypothetical protein [Sulfurimonas sp.]MDD5401401.1 hypothetical protein [Sulfurimonas sp.]
MKINSLKSLFYISGLLLSIFTGCSDNNEKNKKTNESASLSSQTAPTQKIEVVQNENAKEIKVAQKEYDENQSKSYYYDYNAKSEHDSHGSHDLNAKPTNNDASERTNPRTPLEANLHIRSPYEQVQVSMGMKKLSKNFIVKCSACHNDYGNGIIGPSLLGKDSDYIFNKIVKFKDGTSKNVLMSGLVDRMDEKEIRELANEIFEFNKIIKEARK